MPTLEHKIDNVKGYIHVCKDDYLYLRRFNSHGKQIGLNIGSLTIIMTAVQWDSITSKERLDAITPDKTKPPRR